LKRRFGGYKANSANNPGTLIGGLMQVEWLTRHLGTLNGCAVLEIGTGWEPIIPLVYRLAGARIIYLTDSTRLVCQESLDAALAFLTASRAQICAALKTPEAEFDRILARRRSEHSVEARLKALDLLYLAPCDCRSLQLDSGSLDVIYSRSVLEHIPAPIIREIFREAMRLLKPAALMCHFIDNSDHCEHHDKSISRVNFLQHNNFDWRFTCVNPFHYQNRLRHQEYLHMLADGGFKILRAERDIHQRSLTLLPELKLAPQFQSRPHDDLAAISSYLLA